MRLFKPPMRWIRWPFSPFATVVMLVIPIFWPVLAVIAFAEVFCLAMWLFVLVVGNAGVLVAMLVERLCVLAVRGRSERQPPQIPGRDAARPRVR